MKRTVVLLMMFLGLVSLGAVEPLLRIAGYPEERLLGTVKEIKEFTGNAWSDLRISKLIVLNEQGDVSSVEQ